MHSSKALTSTLAERADLAQRAIDNLTREIDYHRREATRARFERELWKAKLARAEKRLNKAYK